MTGRIYSIVAQCGSATIAFGETIWGMVTLLYDTLCELLNMLSKKEYGSSYKQIVSQILFTGVEALGLVSIIAIVCGVTIVIQAMTNMPKLGASEYFGNLLVVIVVRELGPFFTSLVIIGRSGAALAAYIGNMRVSKEVAALEVMGIDPIHYLVLPAFVGIVVSMICLTVYFSLIAIVGGLMVAGITVHMPLGIFFAKVFEAISFGRDILPMLIKTFLFGVTIATISCYYGLTVNNIREVPKVTIKSVVSSMIATIGINGIVTILMFLYIK